MEITFALDIGWPILLIEWLFLGIAFFVAKEHLEKPAGQLSIPEGSNPLACG